MQCAISILEAIYKNWLFVVSSHNAPIGRGNVYYTALFHQLALLKNIAPTDEHTLNYIPFSIGRLSSNQSPHKKTRTDFLEIRTSTNQVDTKTRTAIRYDYNSPTLRNMKPAEQLLLTYTAMTQEQIQGGHKLDDKQLPA